MPKRGLSAISSWNARTAWSSSPRVKCPNATLYFLRSSGATSAMRFFTPRLAVSRKRSDSAVIEAAAQLGHAFGDAAQVRMHAQRALEPAQRGRVGLELGVDQAHARERGEVARLELEHHAHVAHRRLVVAHLVVGRGALVPGLGELGRALDQVREDLEGGG